MRNKIDVPPPLVVPIPLMAGSAMPDKFSQSSQNSSQRSYRGSGYPIVLWGGTCELSGVRLPLLMLPEDAVNEKHIRRLGRHEARTWWLALRCRRPVSVASATENDVGAGETRWRSCRNGGLRMVKCDGCSQHELSGQHPSSPSTGHR